MLGPEPTENREILGDDILSQHGKVDEPFQNSLRPLRHKPGNYERDVSLILGEATVEEATNQRYGVGTNRDYSRYAVRHTTAAALRDKGFRVEHTGRYPARPYHVSVFWDKGAWGPDQAKAFDSCYEEGGGTDG